MTRPLTYLAEFVSVVGGGIIWVPFVLSAYHHCVPRKTTKPTRVTWLLWGLCCLFLLRSIYVRFGWPHCLDKAWTVHNVVLRTPTSKALCLVHV